jgi:hypothetical protein
MNNFEIKEAFNLIWDLITTDMFLTKIKDFVHPEDMQLYGLIRGFQINSKLNTVEERLSNLESKVRVIDPEDIGVPMDEESIEIRRILAEGILEE